MINLRRYTPLFYQDGKFRCRVNRHEVAELLTNGEADPKCERCGSTTGEDFCIDGEHHDLVLILTEVERTGPPTVDSRREIEAYAGVHGCIPRWAVQAKFREALEIEAKRQAALRGEQR